ncbi:hypothetical protein CF327_g190 [Tilletia walkeri]|nr:hypothetical protein CF327_g190 [Tilletia walkeri]
MCVDFLRRSSSPGIALPSSDNDYDYDADDDDSTMDVRHYTSFAFVGVGGFGKLIARNFLNPDSVHKISKVSIITQHPPDNYAEFDQEKAEVIGGVDYSDHDALTVALSGHEVVISTFSTMRQEGVIHQLAFIRAAKRAGIKLFVLSEFGFDISHFEPDKVPSLIRVKYQARALAEDLALPWLGVQAGLFSTILHHPELALDVKTRTARILGKGDHRFPVSAESDAARFVHAVFTSGRLPPAALNNASLRTQSFYLSWTEIDQAIETKQGSSWTIEHRSEEDARAMNADGLDGDEARIGAWILLEIEAGNVEVDDNDNARVGFQPRIAVEDLF